MSVRTRSIAVFLLLAVPAGCEDIPAGPDGMPLGGPGASRAAGLSLDDLFAAAVFRIHREEGADSMRTVLETWRTAEQDAGRLEARRVEASTIVDVFGPGVVDQAALIVRGAWQDAETATAAADVAAIEARRLLDQSARELEFAGTLGAGQPVDALIALDDAAGRIAELRRAVADAERPATLNALYERALARAPADAARERESDGRLAAAVEQAQAQDDVGRRYEALEERRAARSAFVARILGPDAATDLLRDVDARVAEAGPHLDELESGGIDVARERRMLEAVETIAERARQALDGGDVARAIDVAAHAAGLAEQLPQRR